METPKKTIVIYTIVRRNDAKMFYDYEKDYVIWIVKALEGIFVVSIGKESREFAIKILKEQAKLYPWLNKIISREFLPRIFFVNAIDYSYNFYNKHWEFFTTEGIISINYKK